VTFLWALAASSPGFATAANVTAYLAGSANAGSGLASISIPSEALSVGSLTLLVTLTNFLGGTATSEAITVTVVAASAKPSVVLQPPQLTIYRSEEVALLASATLPRCASPKTLAYRWTAQPGVASTSRDGGSTPFINLERTRSSCMDDREDKVIGITILL
jgi:hypothetical protein